MYKEPAGFSIPGDAMALADLIISTGEKEVDEVEVYISSAREISAELKRNLIGVSSGGESLGIAIRIVRDNHIGTSSSNNPELWRQCLDAAIVSARFADTQEWGGFPGRSELRSDIHTHDPGFKISAGHAEELVEGLLGGAAEYPLADVAGGSASLSCAEIFIANSSGAGYSMKKTHASASLEAIREQSTGYEFDTTVNLRDLDPWKVGKEAAFLASESHGAGEIMTGRYDIILSPLASSELVGGIVSSALSGKNLQAGRSYFAGKQGEAVADERLSIYDDPYSDSTGCRPFDADAVPARVNRFISGGVLESFAYDLRAAYRYGEETTGNAVRSGPGGAPAIGMHNLRIEGGQGDHMAGKGVYVHSVVGAHTANPLTGDFSVELSNAFVVEDGTFERPVRSAMLSGNIFSMLRETACLGKDKRNIGNMTFPSIRFNSLHIIGK